MIAIKDVLDSQILQEIRRIQKNIILRRRIIIGCVITIPVCIALILLFNFVFYYSIPESVMAIPFIIPFPCAFYLMFFAPRAIIKLYDKQKKLLWDYAITDILSKFFDVLEYNSKSHIPHNIIRVSNAVLGYEHMNGSDQIKGTYKSRYFEYSELSFTRYETAHDGMGGQVVFFSGPWFVVQFNKALPGRVLIRENNRSHKIIGNIGSLKKTATGDAAFDRKFTVYTDDLATMSYILTPDLLTKILEKSNAVGSVLHISIVAGRLYLAHKNAGLFNVSFTNEELLSIEVIKDKYTSKLQRYIDILDLFIDSGKLDS